METPFSPFFSAVRFFTTIPVPLSWCGRIENIERGLRWYTLIGLMIGLLLAGWDRCLLHLFPALPSAALTITFWLVITGGFHMDGVADTADGFFSSRPKERILEILKDSRTGAMGVMAIVLVTVIKLSALASLPPNARATALLLAPVAGRFAALFVMNRFPYARTSGLSSIYLAGRSHKVLGISAGIFMAAALLFWQRTGILLILFTIAFAWAFGHWCKTKIDGFAGDNLGAVLEIMEAISLLIAVAATTGGTL